jgi:serine/threonine protein kinase
VTELRPGTVFAGHRIKGVVGRGGMGVVYRATQLDLDRTVALKVVAPELQEDETARRRFLHESRRAASIDHPHVVPIHYAGEEDGVPYLVMRYVVGDDARTLVRRDGPLEPTRTAAIVAQVAGALDAAHSAGLVHRDVKPANVLLGASDHAYLSDFGLARHVQSISSATGSGHWVGTLDYVAPEQIRGDAVDARTDVYALGCLLYFLLTASVPFPREGDEAKLWAHLTERPPRPSERGAPEAFDPVISRALAKAPDDRYPSAGDLGRAAQGAATGVAVTEPERAVARGDAASHETRTRSTPRSRRPHRRWAALVGAIGVGAAGAVLAVVLADPGTHDPATRAAIRATPTPTPTPTPKPTATTPRGGVAGRIRWGQRPNTLAVAGDLVWVGALRSGRLAAIDTKTGRRLARLQPVAAGGTTDMLLAYDRLWVGTRTLQVLRLDPRTGRPAAPPIPVRRDPAELAVHGDTLWVAAEDGSGAEILRFDARTGALEASIPSIPNISGMAYAYGHVWTLHGGPNHLVERDPETLRTVKFISLPGGVAGALATGGGALWVTVTDEDELVRYDPRTHRRATVSVGGHPIGVAARGSRVLVAANGASTLVRLRVRTLRRCGAPTRVPLNPLTVAMSGHTAWVTCVGENVVARVRLSGPGA